ncbi:MAG: hypothetical protein ABIF19_18965, partial [Planctomycetota bacterium]
TELTGVPFAKLADHAKNSGPQISFNRPRLSPCLAKFDDTGDAGYIEALAIIEAGKLMLERRPRADMPGFEACLKDQQRQQDYAMRQDVEMRNRQALQNGRKLYDSSQ